MAPHWTLALILAISVFLGTSRASITCEADGFFQCVAKNNCSPSFEYRSNVPGCGIDQVCCANEDVLKQIRNDQQCKGNDVCVPINLCRTELQFRSSGKCPEPMICCKVEDSNTLSILDPI